MAARGAWAGQFLQCNRDSQRALESRHASIRAQLWRSTNSHRATPERPPGCAAASAFGQESLPCHCRCTLAAGAAFQGFVSPTRPPCALASPARVSGRGCLLSGDKARQGALAPKEGWAGGAVSGMQQRRPTCYGSERCANTWETSPARIRCQPARGLCKCPLGAAFVQESAIAGAPQPLDRRYREYPRPPLLRPTHHGGRWSLRGAGLSHPPAPRPGSVLASG